MKRAYTNFTHDSHPAVERSVPNPITHEWTTPKPLVLNSTLANMIRAGATGYGYEGIDWIEMSQPIVEYPERTTLPVEADARKDVPIATAFMDYFPDAIAAVAAVSRAGQKQHGTTGWDKSKSQDEADCLMRHFLERGTIDTDGHRHSAKAAWRALALLQREIEASLR